MTVLSEKATAEARTALGGPAVDILVLPQTGSTNDDAKAMLASGAPSGSVVIAEAQSSGRGRGGNTWHSPPNVNVYMSVGLRATLSSFVLPPFSLVVGLAVAECIESFGVHAGIKWPNDVWIGDAKIAGVLMEAVHRASAPPTVVVGVGLNVNQSEFPPELRATSVLLCAGRPADRNLLVARLSWTIASYFEQFQAHGFALFRERVVARDVLMGRSVTVGEIRGEAQGISAGGELLITCLDGTIVPISSGHVELL